MREIVETLSIFGTRIRQWIAGTAERFAPNSHGTRVWSFDRMSLNRSKVKGQGHQGQKSAVHSQHPRGTDGNGLNALVADSSELQSGPQVFGLHADR